MPPTSLDSPSSPVLKLTDDPKPGIVRARCSSTPSKSAATRSSNDRVRNHFGRLLGRRTSLQDVSRYTLAEGVAEIANSDERVKLTPISTLVGKPTAEGPVEFREEI